MTEEKRMFDSDEPVSGDVAKAVALVDAIEKALAETGESETVLEENEFEFPLKTAIELLPAQYLRQVDDNDIAGMTIVVKQDDIFEQLRNGSVKLPVSRLVYFVPMHLVYRAACDEQEFVNLPLQTVIASIGIDKLKRNTPQAQRQYDIDGIDDPFKQPDYEESSYLLEKERPVELEDDETEPDASTRAQDEQGDTEHTVFSEVAERHGVEDTSAAQDVQVEEQESGMRTLAAEVFSDNELVYPMAYMPDAVKDCFPDIAGLTGEDDSIRIEAPALYDSLRQGRVTVPAGNIIDAFKAGSSGSTVAGLPDEIELDVSKVVESLGLDIFVRLTPDKVKNWDIENIDDPFEAPETLPEFERAAKKSQGSAKPGGMLAAEGVEVKVLPYVSTRGDDVGLEFRELPGNININAATVDELMSLDGVDAGLARAIVTRREEKGAFKNIFELLEINGLGDAEFRKMTGMKAERKRYHRRKRLAGFLKIPASDVVDLNAVALAVARKSGFSGCVISDGEGLVLAESGADLCGEDLSAVVPRMFRQIHHNMSLTGVENIQTVTMALESLLYTVAVFENVCLIAVHDQSRVSETELVFIRKIAKELSWLLSRRAYVGPA